MKYLSALAFAVVLICSCGNKNKIVGEWTSTGQYEENEVLIFKEDGTMLAVRGKTGESTFPFKTGLVKYSLNTSTNPNQIDYIFYDQEGKEEIFKLKGIIEFLGETSARIGFNANKKELMDMLTRPKDFSSCDIKMLSKK
ncbi:MAG TPA: hypothetical protein PLZ68_20635 [Ferruginibacter sp.]|mgnify:CR=1 FL=1|nr:hypothetical protein [Ferruginibacter sp.]